MGLISKGADMNIPMSTHSTQQFNATRTFGFALLLSVCGTVMNGFAQTPVMRLNLNEDAGAITFTDSSGNGNNGSCSGATCPQSEVSGAIATAALTNGASTYISVPGNGSLKPATTVAVAAYVKTATAPPNGGEVVSMGDSYHLRVLSSGNVRFSYYIGSNTWMYLDTTGVNVLDNVFHHLVGQKTATGIEIYVGGVLRASVSAGGTISYTLGPNMNIGRHANGDPTRYFNGTIDEVNVYAQALTASEITALAAGGLRTDKDTVIGVNTTLAPVKGVPITDPNFPGVQILRVTDPTDSTTADGCKNEYSYFPSMNSNSTRILVICDGTNYIQDFDPTTLTLVGPKYLAVTGSSPSSIVWSPVNPDILVYFSGPKLFWKNVATGASGVERDFTAELGAGNQIWGVTRSEDNDWYAFIKATGDPTVDANKLGYIVWRRSTNAIWANINFQPLHAVKIDRTGRYLDIIKGGSTPVGQVGVWIMDIVTGSVTSITNDTTQKMPGHYDPGSANLAATGDCCNVLTSRTLNTAQNIQNPTTIIGWQSEWFNCRGVGARGAHLSMLADNQSWALVSTYDDTGVYPCSPGTPTWLREQNEIFQVATDGSQRVRRITHHHSYYSNYSYWDLPKANISKDGRFVVWTSRWQGATKRDVFMAIISTAP
jgi:hypothetical protein